MRQALELALEALQVATTPLAKDRQEVLRAITAIKEALAQPEQPKVRTGDCLLVGVCASEGHKIQVKQEPWRESASDYERGVIDGRQMQAQSSVDKAVNRMAQPEQDNAYIYASNLAKTIWQKHYMKESPKFALLDTTEGVLTQIDNMTCGLVREKPAQPEQEPVAHFGSAYINENGVHITTVLGPVAIPQDAKLYTTPLQQCYCGDITRLGVVHRADSFCDEKPEQEPVATLDDLEQEIYENTRQFVSRDVMEWMLKRYYTTPPQRKPLTDEEIDQGLLRTNYAMHTAGAWRDGVEWATKQLKEKNT